MAFDFARARVNMVENQVRTNDVTDLAVQDAMKAVPREKLCMPGKQPIAYAEAACAYGDGFFLAEPRDVAKLLQALAPKEGEKAIAIAAPYAAAVLAKIGCRVTARLPVAAAAGVAEALQEAGVAVTGSDLLSIADDGPYDLIVCEGAVDSIPTAWEEALAIGGRLACVERRGPNAKARLVLRGHDALLARRELFDAAATLMPGFEPKAAFSL